MLWNLTEHYRDTENREWIAKVVQILNDIKRKIVMMYSTIRQPKSDIRLLGFSSSISMTDIFEGIGCKPLFMILNQCSFKVESNNTSAKSADNYRIVKGDQWNVFNYHIVARFLSYCHILSRRKIATLEHGGTRVRYRLDPFFAFSEIETELVRLSVIDHVFVSNLTIYGDRPSRKSLIREIENIQRYITQLTCDWVSNLAYEASLGQSIQNLLKKSIRLSVRQLHCIPAYVSILMIRFEWFIRKTPVFLVVRRFCTRGYHNAFYRVSFNSAAIRSYVNAVYEDNSQIVDPGNTNCFCLIPASENCVFTEDWARQPHVVLISNSISGSMAEFYIRMGNNHNCQPHMESCLEYEKFIKNEFTTMNLSQALMHFFSAHDQYPFNLPNSENQQHVVEKIINSTLGHEAATVFNQTLNENYGHQAQCAILGLFNLQHVFTELPMVVAHQTKQIILRKEKPTPYGCIWTTTTDATSISISNID